VRSFDSDANCKEIGLFETEPWADNSFFHVEPAVSEASVDGLPWSLARVETPFDGDRFVYGRGSLARPFQWVEVDLSVAAQAQYRSSGDIGVERRVVRTENVDVTPPQDCVLQGPLRESRIWATSPDGVQVPVSLIWRDGTFGGEFNPDGEDSDVTLLDSRASKAHKPYADRPVLLDVYGSYGICESTFFDAARLDRRCTPTTWHRAFSAPPLTFDTF
jgi:protease II